MAESIRLAQHCGADRTVREDTGQLDRIIAALSNHADGTWLQADELAGNAARRRRMGER